MEPVIKPEKQVHYVTEAEMIRFIEQNSDMEWNDICDFVRRQRITNDEGDKSYWSRDALTSDRGLSYYNEAQIKWVGGFFEAHPFMHAIMIVFDD